MATKLLLFLGTLLLLSPSPASATSLDYYRSAHCDKQDPKLFHLGRYTPSTELEFFDDDSKTCHQAPAGAMAMKMVDGIDQRCTVLAYSDYSCTSLVGTVPASGRCLAAAKAKIGSWKAVCNTHPTSNDKDPEVSYMTSELKRRSMAAGLPRLHRRGAGTVNMTMTTTATITAPCITTARLPDNSTIVATNISGLPLSTAAANANMTMGTGNGTAIVSQTLPGNLTIAAATLSAYRNATAMTVPYKGGAGALSAIEARGLATLSAGIFVVLFGAIVL